MNLSAVLAIAAAVCNGTFGTLSRLERVRQVPAYIFNFWACVGIVLSSLVVLPSVQPVFTPWGLLSGALFVLSNACAFQAIKPLGLSSATGIWCGTAVLVSFAFGLASGDNHVKDFWRTANGVSGIVLGIALVSYSGHVSARERAARSRRYNRVTLPPDTLVVLLDDHTNEAAGDKLQQPAAADDNLPPAQGTLPNNAVRKAPAAAAAAAAAHPRAAGTVVAIAAGLFGGLILAPMQYAPSEAQGLAYLPSMAAGVLLAVVTLTPLLGYVHTGVLLPQLQPRTTALAGIISGVVWNLGNGCSILAIGQLGLAVAYPIMQCGLFVAGLWGMLLYQEISLRAQPIYWSGGVLLVVGAALLAAGVLKVA